MESEDWRLTRSVFPAFLISEALKQSYLRRASRENDGFESVGPGNRANPGCDYLDTVGVGYYVVCGAWGASWPTVQREKTRGIQRTIRRARSSVLLKRNEVGVPVLRTKETLSSTKLWSLDRPGLIGVRRPSSYCLFPSVDNNLTTVRVEHDGKATNRRLGNLSTKRHAELMKPRNLHIQI